MSNDQIPSTSHSREHDDYDEGYEEIREIHALTPPRPHTRQPHSHQSSLVSIPNTGVASTENFTSISREFSALVQAGSSIDHNNISPMMSSNSTSNSNERESYYNNNNSRSFQNLLRIRGDELMEETNPLAIVADNNPLEMVPSSSSSGTINGHQSEVSVQRVKKEEVESKIAAWQNAKVAKINNRYKREDAVINGWENEQVQKANSWMKKVERKLEEKRAKALEKMQNEIARAHRKAQERRASSEAKRGTKIAKILEICNLMRAVGRAPAKRSFF